MGFLALQIVQTLGQDRDHLETHAHNLPIPPAAEFPDDQVFYREAAEIIYTSAAALPANQREALRLRYLRGLSYLQISERMQAPEGTVKIWLYRGRQHMMQKLEKTDLLPLLLEE